MSNGKCLWCRGSGREVAHGMRFVPCRCTYQVHPATKQDKRKARMDALKVAKTVAK